MHYKFGILLSALIATPLAALGDIPMVVIGLPFAPETPRPVDSAHPLHHRIELGEVEGLPTIVKSSALNWIGAAKRSSVNKALRESVDKMNMLAPDTQTAKVRLSVRWVGSETPFRIATSNVASATLHYTLARIDDGRIVFERDITTSVKGGGVDASMRDNGIVRAAIGANFASALNCIDRAAFGSAPADCALEPKFSVAVVRRN